MNDCIGAPAQKWLDRYLEGTLPENEAQAFESHYFDCPVCLGELQAVQAAQEQLRLHPVAIQPKARVLRWPALVTVGSLAAALLIGFITLRAVHRPNSPANQSAASAPSQPSSPAGQTASEPAVQPTQLAQLADLNLPPFHASTLRGESSDTAYSRGMKLYSAGNCTAAVKALARVDATSSDALAAQFYTGVCRMHMGDLDSAQSNLRHVAAAGDSPQEEAAWYYLAQIALSRSAAAPARQNLQKVVALHGDFERAANKQLGQIPRQIPR
jgi:hypothetical protein